VLAEATKAAPRDIWVVARPMLYSDDGPRHIHYALRGRYITLFDLDEVMTALTATIFALFDYGQVNRPLRPVFVVELLDKTQHVVVKQKVQR